MFKKLKRLIESFILFRSLKSIYYLCMGVRVSFAAILFGRLNGFILKSGSVISNNVQVNLGKSGVLVLGENSWLDKHVEIETESIVDIGSGTKVLRRSSINGSVRIGLGCLIAPNVFISSGTHQYRFRPELSIREQDELFALNHGVATKMHSDSPIWIQDDVWLGVNSVVLPGVILGKGAIVAANSVVTENVLPYTINAGTPARQIDKRLNWNPPLVIQSSERADHTYVLSRCNSVKVVSHGFNAFYDEPFIAIISKRSKKIRIHFSNPLNAELRVGNETSVILMNQDCLECNLIHSEELFGGILVKISLIKGSEDHVINITSIYGY